MVLNNFFSSKNIYRISEKKKEVSNSYELPFQYDKYECNSNLIFQCVV